MEKKNHEKHLSYRKTKLKKTHYENDKKKKVRAINYTNNLGFYLINFESIAKSTKPSALTSEFKS